MQNISSRRRRNLLLADVDYVLTELISGCFFMTTALISKKYKEISQRDLMLDLELVDLDLFEIVETMYPNTFIVFRDAMGILRRSCVDKDFSELDNLQNFCNKDEKKAVKNSDGKDDKVENTQARLNNEEVAEKAPHFESAENKLVVSQETDVKEAEVFEEPVLSVKSMPIPLPLSHFCPEKEVTRLLNVESKIECFDSVSCVSDDCYDTVEEMDEIYRQIASECILAMKNMESVGPETVVCEPDKSVSTKQAVLAEVLQKKELGELETKNVLETPSSVKKRLFKLKPSSTSTTQMKREGSLSMDSPVFNEFGISENFGHDEEVVQQVRSAVKDKEGKTHIDSGKFYVLREGEITNYAIVSEHKKNVAKKLLPLVQSNAIQSRWPMKISNVQEVVQLLRVLHELYPTGCTPKQFADFEMAVPKEGSLFKIPFLTNLIDEKMVVARGKLLYMTENVLDFKFIYLRKNLCSNFYRLLISRGGMVAVREALKFKTLLNSAPITEENILNLCNRYPLLFHLDSSESENYVLLSAIVRLNSEVPDWKVVLDCEASEVEGAECDCQECIL